MKWAQVNIQRGLSQKVFEVISWCEENSVDLVSISETGLCSETCFSPHVCAEIPALEGWKWVGAARNIHGGGVGILVRETIAFEVRTDLKKPGVEQIWIEIFRKRLPSILVCSVYIPPGKRQALELFTDLVSDVCSRNRLVLLLGDFNARSTILGDSVDNVLADPLLALISRCNLNLHNTRGTYTRILGASKSVLDLTLSSEALAPLIDGWRTMDDMPSDHCILVFSIKMAGPTHPPRYAWDLRNCDWDLYASEVDTEFVRWLESARSGAFLTVEQMFDTWLDSLLLVVGKCVPRRKLTYRSRAFWSPKIERLVKRRRRYLRAYRRYPTEVARNRYKAAHTAVRSAIRAAKEKLTRSNAEYLRKASRQELFSRLRRVSRSLETQIPTLVVNGEVLQDRISQVRAFNDYFSTAGEERQGENFDNDFKRRIERFVSSYDYDGELWNKDDASRDITVSEIEGAIKRLGTHKAAGPDGVHPLFIKRGGRQLLLSLHFLFNASFESGRLPRKWKLAHIVPIPKKVGCRIPLHRPISLLSIVGKLLDRIAAERVTFQAEKNVWFGPFQGGFRRGRSTTDQLLAFREKICLAQRRGKVCVASFLDLSRAYDRTWRSGVICKLIRLGLRGRLLVWIVNFLQDRFAAVVVAGVRSGVLPYKYGLPQGSCLSPILFNVFLSDLFPHDFITDRRDVGIFADDIRMACYEANVIRGSTMLTNELNKVASFARKWRLAFDVDSNKCGSMTFSFSEPDTQERVVFGNAPLQQLSEYKHLGVIFDRLL